MGYPYDSGNPHLNAMRNYTGPVMGIPTATTRTRTRRTIWGVNLLFFKLGVSTCCSSCNGKSWKTILGNTKSKDLYSQGKKHFASTSEDGIQRREMNDSNWATGIWPKTNCDSTSKHLDPPYSIQKANIKWKINPRTSW